MAGQADDGTGPTPVLLINALGQGAEPWARLRARLTGRPVPLWSPDLTMTGEAQVDAVVALLRAQQRPVHLAAWCTGPKTALRAVTRRPDLVASLLFLNPSFKGPRRRPEVDTPYEADLATMLRTVHGRPHVAARLVTVLRAQRAAGGASPAGLPDELREAGGQPFADAPSLLAYAARHLEFWADDPFADDGVRAVGLPVTVVRGAADVVVAADDVRTVSAHLPQARVETVDAGHFGLHTHAAEVAGLVEAHVRAAETVVPAGR